MRKTHQQRQRVAEFVLRTMGEQGLDGAALTQASGLDAQTVRTFLRGETWPQTKKRTALEDALGLTAGSLELVSRGLNVTQREAEDAVEAAIRRSSLTRADQHTLLGTYYAMLDALMKDVGESK